MDGKLLATGLPSYDLELLQRAFDALHRTTGLEGRLVDISVPGQHGRRADALVEITAEGKRHTYVAVLKRVDRFATLGIIKHQFEQYDKPGLLVTSYVTPEVAERCRTLHIAFIDTAGNAYLQAPGLLVFVKGQRAPRSLSENQHKWHVGLASACHSCLQTAAPATCRIALGKQEAAPVQI
jgi:hypothetical protein